MNILERLVYDRLKKSPALKSLARDFYQSLFDLVPVKKVWSKNPITVREGYFFGFHDHCPFSADNTMLLANRYDIPLRMPEKGESVEVGYFSGSNWETFTPLCKSRAWNWHQGCKLQWRGNLNQLVFNDFAHGKTISRIYCIDTGTLRDLPEAISSISGDGQYGIGYSFARVQKCMPGYGYPYETDEPDLNNPVTSESGIYRINLDSGKIDQLVSIAGLVELAPEESMNGAKHFVSHALFSPSGNRFTFMHRWFKGDVRNRYSRLISMDIQGKDLHIFPARDMVSHVAWRNNEEILAYCRVNNRDAYYLFTDQTGSFKIIGPDVLLSDGHPSVSPDERFVITDTYPDRTRRISLLKYDMEKEELEKLAYLIHPRKFQSSNPYHNWRCDLHPRWDRYGEAVCFDSAHTGTRSLCTMKV
ncbi:hypothetical protein [Natronogracilivirga saccharolytica]|uniref:Uncharacterized protein n=1 Tax=Natronogracilivirga saccharolytica TaxID=2812953 RepID=A0A8J7UVY5_9BACT|nr:hypothetical protein [Natronogracilivirga saccharolytica]MBP3193925.1 hypothetical protein [Natronogracilivirga saccharolytica]